MKAYFATNFVGAFAFDSKGKVLGYRLFPKESGIIREKLGKVKQGILIPEEQELFKELQGKGLKEVFWNKKVCLPGVKCNEEGFEKGEKFLNEQFRKLALDLKWVKNQAELNKILSQVSVQETKEKLKEEKRDKILMNAVGVIDEIDKTLNVFSERLREWYGLHFPELGKLVPDHTQFAKIVGEAGNRENVKEEKAERYKELTSGMEFTEEDSKAVQGFAKQLSGLYKTRSEMEKYLEKASKKAIPNLSAIAGAVLACRLLALAGGLEKLAKMPSSTIQLLGAEKALFRHLKGGGKSPKYGILFSHPLVQKATKPDRGKIARLIAAKLSLAAKTDFFSGEDKSKEMLKDLEKKLGK